MSFSYPISQGLSSSTQDALALSGAAATTTDRPPTDQRTSHVASRFLICPPGPQRRGFRIPSIPWNFRIPTTPSRISAFFLLPSSKATEVEAAFHNRVSYSIQNGNRNLIIRARTPNERPFAAAAMLLSSFFPLTNPNWDDFWHTYSTGLSSVARPEAVTQFLQRMIENSQVAQIASPTIIDICRFLRETGKPVLLYSDDHAIVIDAISENGTVYYRDTRTGCYYEVDSHRFVQFLSEQEKEEAFLFAVRQVDVDADQNEN